MEMQQIPIEPQSDRNEQNRLGVVVFEKNHFRIPALLYIKDWKISMAFAEKRTSSNDKDAINLVMRTGSRQPDGPVQDLMNATMRGFRTMNPCPVFEKNTKTLYLFFICIEGHTEEWKLKPGQTRLCYITSMDCGQHWSELKDITDDIQVANEKLSKYQTFAVGPGHGLEVQSNNGMRLLIPAYVKTRDGKSHSVVFYRDEGEGKWQGGIKLSEQCGECQVAEIQCPEGTRLYFNARTSGKHRMEALSDDAGQSVTPLKKSLPETRGGCQGSVLGFDTKLLYSHPTNTSSRTDLGIYLRESPNGPWGDPYIILQGTSGYSDLTQCEEENCFACLMECGEPDSLQIIYKEFSLNDIPRPKSTCSSCCCCL